MRVGIGISTGTEVVCAALLVVEDDGSSTVEYRTISTDGEINTDIGDLVASAIELMASLAPSPPGQGAHTHERLEPDAIAVAHRTSEQASSVRSACGRSGRKVFLVSETDAAHSYLEDSGLVARYDTVTVVDIGASGTTAAVIDAHSGAVEGAERTKHFGGDVADRLVKDLVDGNTAAQRSIRDDVRDDRGVGSARYRSVKEHLSTHDSAELGGIGVPADVDRVAFEHAVRPYAVSAAQFTSRVAAAAGATPEAVVLIGGGSKSPVVARVFGETLGVPVLSPGEPDTILAKGAAHLALTAPAGRLTALGSDSTAKTIGRLGTAVAGAALVGGIVLAYGIQTLVPQDDSSYAPAGTEAATSETATAENLSDAGDDTAQPVVSTTGPTSGRVDSRDTPLPPASASPSITAPSTTTPMLHPAPDLPVIRWPAAPPESTLSSRPSELSTTRPASPTPITTSPQMPPVTTTPGTDESTDQPPTDDPTIVTPTPAPETPTAAPGESPEVSAPTALEPPSVVVPTREVNATPELTPPTTVWTAPPNVEPSPRSQVPASSNAAPTSN